MVPKRTSMTASGGNSCSAVTALRTAAITSLQSLAARALDFGDNDQPLAAGDIDRERRDSLRLNSLAGPLDRQLDVLRIAIDAADDDQVLDPAGDEQLAVDQKAQIARAQKRSFVRSRRYAR